MIQQAKVQWRELAFLATFVTGYEIYLALFMIALAWIPLSDQWRSLPLWQGFLLSLVIQLLVYIVVTAGIWFAYGMLRRWFGMGGLLDGRPLKKNQIAMEIRRGLVTCGVYAVYTLICLKLSKGIWAESWVIGLLQTAAFLALYDFWFYLTHRVLHAPRLRAFHGTHHQSVRVTPWSVHSLHPVEAAINQFPFLLFMLLWPTGFGLIILFQVILMFMTASGHSNYDPFANRSGLVKAKSFWRFHQRHHAVAKGNYGFMGLHWDIVFGTAQSPLKVD